MTTNSNIVVDFPPVIFRVHFDLQHIQFNRWAGILILHLKILLVQPNLNSFRLKAVHTMRSCYNVGLKHVLKEAIQNY